LRTVRTLGFFLSTTFGWTIFAWGKSSIKPQHVHKLTYLDVL
jgi:hypothetical protein